MSAEIERIRGEERKWERKTVEMAEKLPGARKEVATPSGIPIKWIYTPEDTQGLDYLRDLNFPGEYPYVRGVYPTMYRGRLWSMRTISGWGSPEASNQRLKFLLEQGETGLNFHPDLPTGVGYDSDDPKAEGQVGVVGTPISTLKDLEETFEGIPIEKISVSIIENATAPIILAMYIAMAERRGLPIAELEGSIQNDMLKEYEMTGTGYMVGPEGGLKMSVDIIEYCTRHMPRWNTVTFCTYVFRDHGMSTAHELGFGLANARAYVRACLERGLNIDDFAPRLAFFWQTGINLFEEVAKFRAARRMWARMMREEFGAENPRSWLMRSSCSTGGSTLTTQQPLNNLARLTLETLAAVLGGLQSINTQSLDEGLGLPTEETAMLSLRIQQIIAHESGVADVIDPLGGSYFIESLTKSLEGKAYQYLDAVEKQGGPLAAIRSGFFDSEVTRESTRWVEELEEGKRILVGVNAFQVEEKEPPLETFRGGPAFEEGRKAELARFRQRRDNAAVERALEVLREAIRGEENLMPSFIEAVKAEATLGEICRVLKEFYGEYRPVYLKARC